MPTRRDFIRNSAAAGAVTAAALQVSCSIKGDGSKEYLTNPIKQNGNSSLVSSIIRREDTIVRHNVHGDNWHLSWANDGRQYISLCDGYGPFKANQEAFNSRLLAISGDPNDVHFEDVHAYPQLIPAIVGGNVPARYYNFGTLALDGNIYQYLSTFNHAFSKPDGSPWSELRYVGAKLIYSPDNGRTWCNQDGSTPVVWEPWDRRSRDNMIFFEEPQEAFSLLSILQMGRNYEANRDGYVYVYAPDGNTEGTMNRLVMFRVPKAQILNRDAYEYFAGLTSSVDARWTKSIADRGIVHTFPSGWVGQELHPWSWMPSVTYNEPLALYMMANWGTGSASDGTWFGKPSYLGIWTAENPWGPWRQIHEEPAWMPGNDPQARAYSPQIVPGWIAKDGKSFVLAWTDFQTRDPEDFARMEAGFTEKRLRNQMTREDWSQWADVWRKHKPYYSFNSQRVDLVMA